jgi:hypothetical protein
VGYTGRLLIQNIRSACQGIGCLVSVAHGSNKTAPRPSFRDRLPATQVHHVGDTQNPTDRCHPKKPKHCLAAWALRNMRSYLEVATLIGLPMTTSKRYYIWKPVSIYFPLWHWINWTCCGDLREWFGRHQTDFRRPNLSKQTWLFQLTRAFSARHFGLVMPRRRYDSCLFGIQAGDLNGMLFRTNSLQCKGLASPYQQSMQRHPSPSMYNHYRHVEE